MRDKISSILSSCLEFMLLVVFVMMLLVGVIALVVMFLFSTALLFYGSTHGILFSVLGLFLLSLGISILICVLSHLD